MISVSMRDASRYHLSFCEVASNLLVLLQLPSLLLSQHKPSFQGEHGYANIMKYEFRLLNCDRE